MTMATKIVLMNEGKIQQDGKPEEFYNRPANIFVARFIGSPTMNIFEGKIENGRFVSNDSYIKAEPKPEDKVKVSEYEGKRVSLGIRAERFRRVEKEPLGDTFECELDVMEMLGKEKILFTKLPNGQDITISVPGYLDYVPGNKYMFGFDLDALHFFDAETGLRIN